MIRIKAFRIQGHDFMIHILSIYMPIYDKNKRLVKVGYMERLHDTYLCTYAYMIRIKAFRQQRICFIQEKEEKQLFKTIDAK